VKFSFVAFLTLYGLLFVPALSPDVDAQGQDPAGKAPVVESGYITKIDLKKKVLTVQGYIQSLPADIPGQKPGSSRTGVQLSVEEGRGNSAAGKNVQTGKNETSAAIDGAKPERIREFKVYIGSNTIIQQGTTALELKELSVKDYVMVVGAPKGKVDVVAASIAVSAR